MCNIRAQYPPPPPYGIPAGISTPNGDTVPDSWIITQETMDYSTIENINDIYDNKPEVIDRTRPASSLYNCRGYAWHMYDDHINEQVWIGTVLPNVAEVYWNDLSYDTVPYEFATIVYYEGEHTAVIKSHADSICESKWCNEPRFTHYIDWLPYLEEESPPLNYTLYAKPIEISYNQHTGICGVSITVEDPEGIEYSWSVGDFLTITDGGNASSCTVSKTFRPQGTSPDSFIEVYIERNEDYYTAHKDIYLGERPRLTISGPTTVCDYGTATYSINSPEGATIVWDSGTGLTRTSPQGANPCNFSVSGSGASNVSAVITYDGQNYTADNLTVYRESVPSTPSMNVVGASGSGGNYTVPLNSSPVYFTLYGGYNVSYGWNTWGISSSYDITGNALDLYPDVADYNMISGYVYNSCYQSQNVSVYLEVTEYRLLLAPNPASQYVDIELVPSEEGLMIDGDYSIDFIDPFSKIAKRETLSGNKNRVNIQDLPKGFYVVTLRYGKKSYSTKLLVE